MRNQTFGKLLDSILYKHSKQIQQILNTKIHFVAVSLAAYVFRGPNNKVVGHWGFSHKSLFQVYKFNTNYLLLNKREREYLPILKTIHLKRN